MLNRLKQMLKPHPEASKTRPPITVPCRACPHCRLFLINPKGLNFQCPNCWKTIRTWLNPDTRELHLLTPSQYKRLRRNLRT